MSRAVRSVVQCPTAELRTIIFLVVFVSLSFLLCVLSVTLSGALFSSTNQILLWLLCWASFYNGIENIFHVSERSE